jgi:hypothetical protein
VPNQVKLSRTAAIVLRSRWTGESLAVCAGSSSRLDM